MPATQHCEGHMLAAHLQIVASGQSVPACCSRISSFDSIELRQSINPLAALDTDGQLMPSSVIDMLQQLLSDEWELHLCSTNELSQPSLTSHAPGHMLHHQWLAAATAEQRQQPLGSLWVLLLMLWLACAGNEVTRGRLSHTSKSCAQARHGCSCAPSTGACSLATYMKAQLVPRCKGGCGATSSCSAAHSHLQGCWLPIDPLNMFCRPRNKYLSPQ